MLDPVENAVAIDGADDIAEYAAQKLYFLPQAGVLLILRHGVRLLKIVDHQFICSLVTLTLNPRISAWPMT